MTSIVSASDVKTREKHYVVRFSNGAYVWSNSVIGVLPFFQKSYSHFPGEDPPSHYYYP